jgi:hypothetical protein
MMGATYKVKSVDWLPPPHKWALLVRISPTRIGWDCIGAFETKREALEALREERKTAALK